jgi:phosphoribosylformimino-5-aminoimidazole carboxamide ribonucleotide (ProFAR) isomerase
MLAEANVPVQVGGGVRTDDRVEELLAAGAGVAPAWCALACWR